MKKKLTFANSRAVYDWAMANYNIPQPHLISTIKAKNLTTGDALSELIDNALRFKATEIRIEFDKTSVTVSDNGEGNEDPSLVFGYARTTSQSGQSDISIYGVGAKDAEMTFGTKAVVHTVHNGVYREQSIDWHEVEHNGWPERTARLKERPLTYAPKFIQNGGLILMITALHKKIRNNSRWLDQLCKELAQRYRPAIKRGVNITLVDGKDVHVLSAALSSLGIYKFQLQEPGETAYGKFFVRCSDMKEYNARLGGVHIAYGDRFIKRITSLNKHAVPQSLYAEVILTSRWRKQLTPNKTDIQADALTALCDAVYVILKPMMDLLKNAEDEIAITDIDFAIRDMTDNVIILDLTRKGKFGAGKKIPMKKHGENPHPDPDPDPRPESDENLADPDKGENASKQTPNISLGIRVRPDPKANHSVGYRYESDSEESTPIFRVWVNRRDFPLIASAYLAPYKLNVLTPLVATAFADWACEEIKEHPDGGQLCKLIEALNARGANIKTDMRHEDFKAWVDFRTKVASHILAQFKLSGEDKRRLEESSGNEESIAS
jgi:hypothetical protein